MGIKSNNPAAIYHDFFSRSGTDAVKPYVLYNPLYSDDVFSTFLYDGTGAAQTITNDIDLSGEGGLVWLKSRGNNYGWRMVDTERGATKALESYDATAEATESNGLTAFTGTGFSVDAQGHYNGSGYDMASFTFRKCPGFFDIVTYTGNSTAGRQISHSLGSVPGCIMIKCTSHSDNWYVYHRSTGATQVTLLNTTNAAYTSDKFNDTLPTSTYFELPADASTNGNGRTFVAYLFAHDDQSFGTDGDEAIIKCGSYAATGSAQTVNLGFEPQFLITKKTSGIGEWRINDMMRGIVTGGADAQMDADSSSAEITGNVTCDLTPSGFITNGSQNDGGNTYIYIAIRRPHKPPETATDVFAVNTESNDNNYTTTGFPVDAAISINRDGSTHTSLIGAKLIGDNVLKTGLTNSESAALTYQTAYAFMDKFRYAFWGANTNGFVNYAFKRAPGFFDVSTWTGDGVTGRTVNHNLTVAPELMLVKRRSGTENWYVYHKQPGATQSAFINSGPFGSSGAWNDTEPTDTTITLLGDNAVNGSGQTYVGYFFATLAGISKVGSYTGTGAAQNIDCGFTNGARFVLIKRTDSTGDWVVYDTARGINTGNDPELTINNTSAEATNKDKVDPYPQGFALTTDTGDTNVSGGTYLFLAIA
jgi:hypothetical protein